MCLAIPGQVTRLGPAPGLATVDGLVIEFFGDMALVSAVAIILLGGAPVEAGLMIIGAVAVGVDTFETGEAEGAGDEVD